MPDPLDERNKTRETVNRIPKNHGWKMLYLLIIPAIIVAAAVVWRHRTAGKRFRNSLIIFVSLLLAVYFLITAALGIFWVARMELPAFDPHYLMGYATLVLVLAHVAFGFRRIVRYFRSGAADKSERQNKTVPLGGVGLLLIGMLCFWLGRQSIETRPPADTPPESKQNVQPRQAELSIMTVREYHKLSSLSTEKLAAPRPRVDLSKKPSIYKKYPGSSSVALSSQWVECSKPLSDALDLEDVIPERGDAPMSFEELSTLLYLTSGITDQARELRAAPSAGARYPTETYVLVQAVKGVSNGLYYYNVKNHELDKLKVTEKPLQMLVQATGQTENMSHAMAILIFSSRFYSSAWKYGDRAYRYCLLDAGHNIQNAMLAANAMAYQSYPLTKFDDGIVNAMLNINPEKESVLSILPISKKEIWEFSGHPYFRTTPVDLKEMSAGPNVGHFHGSTFISYEGRDLGVMFTGVAYEKEKKGKLIDLPMKFDKSKGVAYTIENRRSARSWTTKPLTINNLANLLYNGFSDDNSGSSKIYYFIPYLIINNVNGISPGIYRYWPKLHQLELISLGNHRERAITAALTQKAAGGAVYIIMLFDNIEVSDWISHRQPRLFREGMIAAGMAGERIYLTASSLGLGCVGIGAFFDDQISDLISVPDDYLPVYSLAIGHKK